MKFGFFKDGQLVDSCYAASKEAAISTVEHDEAHEIIDADLITSGNIDFSNITVSGNSDFPVFNPKN